MRLFILLLIISLFSSCAQKSGTTNTQFKLTMGALGAPAEFAGGLVVYGQSTINDDHFVKVLESELTVQYEIPNGRWRFFAIGWDGPDYMSGKVYCAKSLGVDLNGSAISVDLSAQNSNCKDSVFGRSIEASGVVSFPSLNIETCNKDILTQDTCNYDANIDTYTNDKGYLASYQFEIKSFFREGTSINAMNGNLVSECVNVSTDSNGLIANPKFSVLNLPSGVETLKTPFSINLKGFYDRDCNTNRGVKNFILKYGINSALSNLKPRFLQATNTINLKTITTTDEVCANSTQFSTQFPAGLGTSAHPYVICNPKQLSQITSKGLTKSYVLGKDLNMSIEAALLKQQNDFDCTEDADNFLPVGGFSQGCDGIPQETDTFSGTFDGQNYLIKNLTFEGGTSNIGLFRWASGTIENTRFENVNIEGASNIAVVVGKCKGCQIKNIHIKNARVRSDGKTSSKIAVIAGESLLNSNIENTYVTDSSIRAEGIGIGTIVGDASASTISKAISENVSIEGTSIIGGIVGSTNGSTVSEVGNSGVISVEGDDTNGATAGGIAGSISNSSSINYAYSNTLVEVKRGLNEINAGGLVGLVSDAPSEVKFSYALGKVNFDCTNGTIANCKVGTLIGENTGAIDALLSDQDQFILGHGGVPDVAGTLTNSSFLNPANNLENDLGDVAPQDKWIHHNGFYPRLKHEIAFACNDTNNSKSVADQKTDGRGSVINPIRICNRSQFLDISTDYYVIESPINLGEFTGGDLIGNFSGTLDGNYKTLYGLELKGAAASPTALISSTSDKAWIKKLRLHGTILEADNSELNSLLVATNNGKITDSKVSGDIDEISDLDSGIVSAISNFGFIASSNTQTGQLINAKADGHILAKSNVGSIVNENAGSITDAVAHNSIKLDGNVDDNIGGISASNSGTISKATSEVHFENIDVPAPVNGIKLGGITGSNTGSIDNSEYSYAQMRLFIGDDIDIAGIAGNNEGEVSKTIVSAHMDMSSISAGPNQNFGAMVGAQTGLIDRSYSLNSFNQYLGTAFQIDAGVTAVNCNGGAGPFTLTFRNVNGENDFPDDGSGSEISLLGNNKAIRIFSEFSQDFINVLSSSADISNITTQDFVIGLERCPDVPHDKISSLTFVKTFDHNDVGDIIPFSEFEDMATYCPEMANVAGLTNSQILVYKCQDGFDIASFGGPDPNITPFGFERILSFMKQFYGIPTQNLEKPVWMMQEGPRLLRIND